MASFLINPLTYKVLKHTISKTVRLVLGIPRQKCCFPLKTFGKYVTVNRFLTAIAYTKRTDTKFANIMPEKKKAAGTKLKTFSSTTF